MNVDILRQQNITSQHLGRKGLQLNFEGNIQLAKNIIDKLRSFISSNEPDISLNKEGRSHSSIPFLADDDTDVNELRECSANKEVHPSGRKKGLKLASLNANGLLSKIDEVRQLAKRRKLIFLQNK